VTRHLLDVDDLSPDELRDVLDVAEKPDTPLALAGCTVALLFEKPSNRTRNATEAAVFQLGGHPVSIRGEEVGLGSRETVEDVALTLGCYHAAIGARVNEHSTLERMVSALDNRGWDVPVVNLLSELAHPCQTVADLLTLRQSLGGLEGRTVAWVGDGNNVCRSFVLGASMCGVGVRVATPEGFGLDPELLERAAAFTGPVEVVGRPEEAVAGADAIYTDVWTSMGQEGEAAARLRAFAGWSVDARLVSLAAPHAVVLHCLPAHRGEEITAEVVDGPQSVVWRQARNRLDAARGLFVFLLRGAA
jgi:ornithine carbamoyltransferase